MDGAGQSNLVQGTSAHPDYRRIILERAESLQRLRAKPDALSPLKLYYRDHIADFIEDWALIQEPRNVSLGLPVTIPFCLWPRQRELIAWLLERWRRGENGVVAKSRDSGASWLSVCVGASLCLFYEGVSIGVASRKVELCDGGPKALLPKARFFLQHLPSEFKGGWDPMKHTKHMEITFPGTGSTMSAEGGTNLGRGDRTSMTIVDEAAFLENPEEVDAALSGTTRCRIDISTPHGRDGPFAQKFFSKKIPSFVFSWRDSPLKSQEWYDTQVATLPAHVVAQEINVDFYSSVENIVIPIAWAEAAIDAHRKLGITITGQKYAGFDLADTGDRCAIALRRGILLSHLESWSGAGSDLYSSTVRAFNILDERGWDNTHFDQDGLGAAVTGDAIRINEARQAAERPPIRAEGFRGSGGVYDPTGETIPGRKNQDYFLNAKAQGWWHLRAKFQATFRAVVQNMRPFDPEMLISIDPHLPELSELLIELSQPTFSLNQTGKIVIDKKNGGSSPDRADAVMIAFQPATEWAAIWLKCAGQ